MTSTANATAPGDMHGVQDAEPTDTEHEKASEKAGGTLFWYNWPCGCCVVAIEQM